MNSRWSADSSTNDTIAERPAGRGREAREARVVEAHRDLGGEVLELVAGEAELGEDDEVGALGPGLGRSPRRAGRGSPRARRAAARAGRARSGGSPRGEHTRAMPRSIAFGGRTPDARIRYEKVTEPDADARLRAPATEWPDRPNACGRRPAGHVRGQAGEWARWRRSNDPTYQAVADPRVARDDGDHLRRLRRHGLGASADGRAGHGGTTEAPTAEPPYEGAVYPATGEAPCGTDGLHRELQEDHGGRPPDRPVRAVRPGRRLPVEDRVQRVRDPGRRLPRPRMRRTSRILDQPNGTGPYMLDNWDKGNRLVLKAFDGYWGDKRPDARASSSAGATRPRSAGPSSRPAASTASTTPAPTTSRRSRATRASRSTRARA